MPQRFLLYETWTMGLASVSINPRIHVAKVDRFPAPCLKNYPVDVYFIYLSQTCLQNTDNPLLEEFVVQLHEVGQQVPFLIYRILKLSISAFSKNPVKSKAVLLVE